ncbi:hydantoinase/oxoprolinase family protein [Halarsenatibacter silvermanii]|uniref:N-methylhydantoinase A/oxoprolinase/acetone carboxylase, beta subunit n=1 Tax=Halarsenatibacter silvermanii TaxID=321763 RepID=A0A1G9I4Z0_9FIRM|nr:hydantoinase/oxoprolinase family protein [Halarsenatibacter silvermanii]SDL20162.1 N-methylhydantoinase A/oxoprolinase/acetone carboxylase, beta subunit [Halarsenatibacter silvermanii]
MSELALGIDTGGTFTDGVVMDLGAEEIVTSTKQITTREDLNAAIENCLNDLMADESVLAEKIELVSLSTTLATNAIVEGQGAAVGTLLLGFEPEERLPADEQAVVSGGCSIKGEIKEEIDEQEIREAVREMKGEVDAFAVSGYLSVRNPIQEQKAAEIVREESGCPVVAAHQLTSDLGFQERAVTAVFNARLLPLITELIESVDSLIEERDISAPVMVVRGDGSLISTSEARERPVETSLSGPAASVVGARHLADIENGIIVDMGGTTTDLALLEEGSPRINPRGAMVGGWHTRVKAADITTIGLGGDSLIQISKDGETSIGPQRVFPLSWAAEKYPHLIDELERIRDRNPYTYNYQPVSALVYLSEPERMELNERERELVSVLKDKPHTIWQLGRKLDQDAELLPWEQLVKVGCLHRASLTPTDILHTSGEFDRWNEQASEIALEVMSNRNSQNPEELAEEILNGVYDKITSLVIEAVLGREEDLDFSSREMEYMIARLISPDNGEFLETICRLGPPLVGVGAPVRAYFPEVAEKLNAELKLPEAAEVANAVGTVMGKIIERETIIVRTDEVNVGYLVHLPDEKLGYREFEDAVENAIEKGREYILEKAKRSGGRDIKVEYEREDVYGKVAGSRKEEGIFLETRLEFSAVGQPWS